MTKTERRRIAGFFGKMMTAAAAALCAACTDEFTVADGIAAAEGTPVRFEISRAPLLYAATRAVPEPREWKPDDKIQITATFRGGKMAESDKATQYACYKYVDDAAGGEWIPDTEQDRLMWPVGSDSAKFEAYYVAGLNGRINDGQSTDTLLLGDIEEGGDPLYAVKDSLEYGHSVPLRFGHLCTHLTLRDVKTDLSEGYWLYRKTGDEIPNAYLLGYSKGGGLKFEFVKADTCRTTGDTPHYYVGRQRDANEGSVSFYLAQDTDAAGNGLYKYGDCELSYRFDRPYLSFQKMGSLDSLKSGVHYELSIEKAAGIVPQPETDFPEDPEKDLGEVDIPTLLEGIVEGKDVTDKNGEIVLKVTGEPYPRLMRDVDFRNFNPMDYIEGTGPYADKEHDANWKLPVLGGIFDGNFHSFLNVAYPIFDRINNGEIRNLAIRGTDTTKCDITTEAIQKMQQHHIRGTQQLSEMTDFGILACELDGQIRNLLMENIRMTVHIDNSIVSGETQQRVYRIGCLAGNQGTSASGENATIEDVELRGGMELTVTSDDKEVSEVQDCDIGALVGQSGSLIDGVTSTDTVKVRTPINGKSTVYVGGLVGRVTYGMRNATVNVVADGSSLHGVQTYVGGLCGELVNEYEGRGFLESCTAAVDVSGGTVKPVNTTTKAHAYAGGIAAQVSAATCDDIFIAGSVKGGTETEAVTQNSQMINYATGGAFGYVTHVEASDIKNCNVENTTVTAAVLLTQGIGNDTGSFVGLCNGVTEEQLKAAGNTASSSPQFVGNTEP